MAAIRNHFKRRIDPFTSAILVFPLFMTYQVGIVAGARGRNGVDFVTDALMRACDRDLQVHLQLLAGMVVTYAVVLAWLRRRGRFDPRAFWPMLTEAAVYAFFMGALIQWVIVRFFPFVPALQLGANGLGDVLVISAGAGLHEELVFRAGLMGGASRLLSLTLPRATAWTLALIGSALLFSLAHHVGPAGEAFTAHAFVYRGLAGVFFGLLYQWRGFAVAVWTHALYDVFVLSLGG